MKRPITLINVTEDMDQEEVVQALMAGLRKDKAKQVTKHAAPIHPGTGTDQSVHSGGPMTFSFEYEGEMVTRTIDFPPGWTVSEKKMKSGAPFAECVECGKTTALGIVGITGPGHTRQHEEGNVTPGVPADREGPYRELKITRKFWEDHRDRADEYPGRVVKETARYVTLELNPREWNDLLSDAQYYADDLVASQSGLQGLRASAKSVIDRMDGEKWVTKHMGPGPHPSGSPQTVHRGGMSVGTQDPLFGEQHPTTTIQLNYKKFKWTDMPKELQSSVSRYMTEGRSLTPEERQTIVQAIEEFEDAFPGALPDQIDIIEYSNDRVHGYNADDVYAWTWSNEAINNKGAPARTLYVNTFNFGEEGMRDFLGRMSEQELANFAGLKHMEWPLDVQGAGSRFLFHELAHIAANKIGFVESGRSPRYTADWYVEQVAPSSPLLPSAYAVISEAEFFAEAVTDAYFNKEKASEISLQTAQLFLEATS